MTTAQRQMQQQLAYIRSIDPEAIIPPQERYRFTIKDIGDHGVFRLEKRTYLVVKRGSYLETDDAFKKTLGWTGYELMAVCLESGTIHNLEWEEDDDIKVTLTREQVKFSELRYDDGEALTPDSDDLDEIAEKKWEIMYRGTVFYYEDDYAARYSQNNGNTTENVYFYEFEAENGEQLTIEVWMPENGKEEFQVFTSHDVPPNDIEVIVAGAHAGG